MRAGLLASFAAVLALLGALLYMAHPAEEEANEPAAAPPREAPPSRVEIGARTTAPDPERSGRPDRPGRAGGPGEAATEHQSGGSGDRPSRRPSRLKSRGLAAMHQDVFASPVKPYRLARDAYKRGDYPLAYRRSLEALRLEPKAAGARALAALSACALGKADEARKQAGALDAARYAEVAKQCKRRGVELGPAP